MHASGIPDTERQCTVSVLTLYRWRIPSDSSGTVSRRDTSMSWRCHDEDEVGYEGSRGLQITVMCRYTWRFSEASGRYHYITARVQYMYMYKGITLMYLSLMHPYASGRYTGHARICGISAPRHLRIRGSTRRISGSRDDSEHLMTLRMPATLRVHVSY